MTRRLTTNDRLGKLLADEGSSEAGCGRLLANARGSAPRRGESRVSNGRHV